MRTISGEIALPADVAGTHATSILIELRDVSVADAPSQVIASKTLRRKPLSAGARIPFSIEAPDARGRHLALRVHIVSGGGTRGLGGGEYLSTQTIAVPAEGDAADVVVPVTAI
jgi:putative lipoprotein